MTRDEAPGPTNPIAVRMADIVQKKLIAELYVGLLEYRKLANADRLFKDVCGMHSIIEDLIDKIENSGQHRVD